MKDVKLTISVQAYGPNWRLTPIQIPLTPKVELNLVQITQYFFFLILNLNCFLKVFLGLRGTKQEQLQSHVSLNSTWPKIDTTSTSRLTYEALHVLISLEHCRTQRFGLNQVLVVLVPGYKNCFIVMPHLKADDLMKREIDSSRLRIGHLI